LLLVAVDDELGEHLAHRLLVAAVRGLAGLDVAGGVEAGPVDVVAGVAGELLEECPLGAAVALAERWTLLISAR
jgi:hypothetical protein